MSNETHLYISWTSSASRRVRTAVIFKQIPHNLIPISLENNTHKSAAYLEKNPSGYVPTLYHNGQYLSQSPAILEYLEEAYPNPPLLPKDPFARARVRELMNVVVCDIHPIQNKCVLEKVSELRKTSGRDVEFAQWAIRKGFTALETMLEGTMGKYSYGDEFSMADICIASQFYNAERYLVNVADFPNICTIMEAINSMPCIQQTHPSRQPVV
ncbi:Maleylacetoacetate isomerase [Rhizoclosmatium globosum]|uniref:Maleylacetoacetate isomerase n=1 Tax=Rhizoclosmatium globosum TaxID=329046 RepID=A0A1Y2CB70_9FUNG|nr:Maleylacetoacetate isomerase [Rhizoclosmatium globosum]|eukprot:ORY44094.1 Maleylacetoacetate isomerase [Rhizoclosmatium globosum]